MSNTKARTVTRQPRFDGSVDKDGIRRNQVGDKRKIHTPEVKDLAARLTIPESCTMRDTDTKGGTGKPGAIPYREFTFPISSHDGRKAFVTINCFIEAVEVGQVVSGTMKVARKNVRKGNSSFEVYYIKIETGDAPAEFEIELYANDLAMADAIEAAGGDVMVYDCSILNSNHEGGILIKEL